MPERELTPLEALSYLDDIAHGRKMEYDPHVLKRIVEKGLKRLEELEKAFDSLSKEEEKVMKELSKEIEKNRVLKIIKDNIVFIRALCDKTKNLYNEFIMFEIKGLVDEGTWNKIYEVLKSPLKEVLL